MGLVWTTQLVNTYRPQIMLVTSTTTIPNTNGAVANNPNNNDNTLSYDQHTLFSNRNNNNKDDATTTTARTTEMVDGPTKEKIKTMEPSFDEEPNKLVKEEGPNNEEQNFSDGNTVPRIQESNDDNNSHQEQQQQYLRRNGSSRDDKDDDTERNEPEQRQEPTIPPQDESVSNEGHKKDEEERVEADDSVTKEAATQQQQEDESGTAHVPQEEARDEPQPAPEEKEPTEEEPPKPTSDEEQQEEKPISPPREEEEEDPVQDTEKGSEPQSDQNQEDPPSAEEENGQVVVATEPQSSSSLLPSIAFITFAHLADTSRFDRLIFPSIDTWMAETDAPYFVVLNNQWKDAYEQELCGSTNTTNQPYCQRMEPIWVDCTEGYYGPSPCCKSQEGLRIVYSKYPEYDWYLYQDDDMYMRVRYMQQFLAQFDRDDPAVVSNSMLYPLGVSTFVSAYNCSFYEQDVYPWGQPVLYNYGAMRTMARGLELGSLVQQCDAYEVTHDAGNQILHWMYSFPVLRVSIAQMYPQRIQDPDFEVKDKNSALGVHSVSRGDGSWTMLEVHEHYTKEDVNETMMATPHEYTWHNVTGFHNTPTYLEHGDPSTWQDEWHTMPISDCKPAENEHQLGKVRGFQQANRDAVDEYLRKQRDSGKPTLAFVTFVNHFPNSYDFTLIREALDTFLLRDRLPYFVVLDGYKRDLFYDRYCNSNPVYEEACRRIVPIFVECPHETYVESCLAQQGLRTMLSQYPEFDWFVYMKDQTYVVQEYLHNVVAGMDGRRQAQTITTAEITESSSPTTNILGTGCSDNKNFLYPRGDLIMYSRRAIQKLQQGFAHHSLRHQSVEFFTETINRAFQIVNWMYSIPSATLPVVSKFHDSYDLPDVYCFPRDDSSSSVGVVVDLPRRRQEELERFRSPMVQCHEEREERQAASSSSSSIVFADGDAAVQDARKTLVWQNVTGFRQTRTYHRFGDPSSWEGWHIMNRSDCMEANIAKKKRKQEDVKTKKTTGLRKVANTTRRETKKKTETKTKTETEK